MPHGIRLSLSTRTLHDFLRCRDEDDFQGDQVVPLKMGKRDSFLLADDISLLLGSQSSLDGGEFNAIPLHCLL